MTDSDEEKKKFWVCAVTHSPLCGCRWKTEIACACFIYLFFFYLGEHLGADISGFLSSGDDQHSSFHYYSKKFCYS